MSKTHWKLRQRSLQRQKIRISWQQRKATFNSGTAEYYEYTDRWERRAKHTGRCNSDNGSAVDNHKNMSVKSQWEVVFKVRRSILDRCDVVISMRLSRRDITLLISICGSWIIRLIISLMGVNRWRTSPQNTVIIPVSKMSIDFTRHVASCRHPGLCCASSLISSSTFMAGE